MREDVLFCCPHVIVLFLSFPFGAIIISRNGVGEIRFRPTFAFLVGCAGPSGRGRGLRAGCADVCWSLIFWRATTATAGDGWGRE